jgi:hypothetical protein
MINLISYEGLSGDMYYKSINSKSVADKLKLMFPDAKIVCVIRNQIDMVYSLYKQYIHQGGKMSIHELFDFQNNSKINSIDDHKVPLESLNYINLVKYYKAIFSDENVKIMLYENLKSNKKKFIKEFIDVDFDEIAFIEANITSNDNIGYGHYQILIARKLNSLFHSNFNRYGYIFPIIKIPKLGLTNIFLFRKLMQSNLSFKILGKKPIRDSRMDKEIFDYYSGYNEILKNYISNDNMDTFSKYYLVSALSR